MILDERRIPKGFPTSFAKIARRKLIQLNNADDLGDLTVPPGNRFEALSPHSPDDALISATLVAIQI
jgi:plasmid maintenance system killer protein